MRDSDILKAVASKREKGKIARNSNSSAPAEGVGNRTALLQVEETQLASDADLLLSALRKIRLSALRSATNLMAAVLSSVWQPRKIRIGS